MATYISYTYTSDGQTRQTRPRRRSQLFPTQEVTILVLIFSFSPSHLRLGLLKIRLEFVTSNSFTPSPGEVLWGVARTNGSTTHKRSSMGTSLPVALDETAALDDTRRKYLGDHAGSAKHS